MNKKILNFLGVKNPKELIGKTLKVSFFHLEEGIHYDLFFIINSFTLEKEELSFPPIPLGQGLSKIQISIFPDKKYPPFSFHIAINRKEKDGRHRQEAYFYSTKGCESENLSRGKIQIV